MAATATMSALQRLRERRAAARDAETMFVDRNAVETDMAEVIRESKRHHRERTGESRAPRAGDAPESVDGSTTSEEHVPAVIRRLRANARKRAQAFRDRDTLYRDRQCHPAPTAPPARPVDPKLVAYHEFYHFAEKMTDELEEPYTVERLILGLGTDAQRDHPDFLRILPVSAARERARARRPLHDWAHAADGAYAVPEDVLQALQGHHDPEEIETLISFATLWKAKLATIRQRTRERWTQERQGATR